jgi:hypothetical protein
MRKTRLRPKIVRRYFTYLPFQIKIVREYRNDTFLTKYAHGQINIL